MLNQGKFRGKKYFKINCEEIIFMNPTYKVGLNTTFLFARMLITVLISFYTTRVVLASLGVEDFGTYNLIGGIVSMLTFLNASMVTASQRFMSFMHGTGNLQNQRLVFNISIWLHIVIAFFTLVILKFVGPILFNGLLNIPLTNIDTAKCIYQLITISTFFTIASVPYEGVIIAREKMLMLSIFSVTESILKLIIAYIIFEFNGNKLLEYGYLMTALSIGLQLARLIYCHAYYPECKILPINKLSRKYILEITAFAGWSGIGTSTSILTNYGQGLLLNMFFGTTVNAAQGVVGQITGQLSALANSLMQALTPSIVKSEGANERKTVLETATIGSKISFFLLMFLYIPILIEMPYVFNLWLKVVPEYAVIFCVLMLLKKLVEQLFLTLNIAIIAVGRIKIYQIVSSLITILPLPISYILFSYGFQAYLIYIVFLIYSVIMGGVTLFFACHYCNFSYRRYLIDVILRCLISFGIAIAISSIPVYFMDEGLLRLFIIGFFSVSVFFVTVWFIGFSSSEQKMLRTLFQKLINKTLLRINFRYTKRDKK